MKEYSSSDGFLLSQDGTELITVPTGVTAVSIPDSVLKVCSKAFAGCTKLKTVTIPDSVVEIGDYAFDECRSLTSLILPASVVKIGNAIVIYCSNLKTLEVADENPAYKSQDGMLLTKDGKLLMTAAGTLAKVIIPDTVKTIDGAAFLGLKSLKEITFNDGLECIRNDAFRHCESLESVVFPDSLRFIDCMAFENCPSLKSASLAPNTECYTIPSCVFDTSAGIEITYRYNFKEIPRRFADMFKFSSFLFPREFDNLGFDEYSTIKPDSQLIKGFQKVLLDTHIPWGEQLYNFAEFVDAKKSPGGAYLVNFDTALYQRDTHKSLPLRVSMLLTGWLACKCYNTLRPTDASKVTFRIDAEDGRFVCRMTFIEKSWTFNCGILDAKRASEIISMIENNRGSDLSHLIDWQEEDNQQGIEIENHFDINYALWQMLIDAIANDIPAIVTELRNLGFDNTPPPPLLIALPPPSPKQKSDECSTLYQYNGSPDIMRFALEDRLKALINNREFSDRIRTLVKTYLPPDRPPCPYYQ